MINYNIFFVYKTNPIIITYNHIFCNFLKKFDWNFGDDNAFSKNIQSCSDIGVIVSARLFSNIL